MPVVEEALRTEVEERLGRPFDDVREQLTSMLGMDWDEAEVVISTASDKQDRSEADVICDLVAKAERKPPVQQKLRRAVVKWIGKPWRERENPWDKYKDRIPDPPSTDTEAGDLEEWSPLRPEEHD